MALLTLFSDDHRELTVGEISRELDIPLASAYRTVHTMERRGFLERSGATGPYRLGMRLLHLGRLVHQRLDLREVARPVMVRLAADVGETAVLMVPHPDCVVCVENVEGSSPIRPRSITVGERRAYNGGAAGLAVLAFLPDEQRDRIINHHLEPITPRTVTDADAVRARCEEIRRSGVSYSEGEVIEGTAAVAAPIFAAEADEVVGSISLTGIVPRIAGLEDTLRAAAAEISAALGVEDPAGTGG